MCVCVCVDSKIRLVTIELICGILKKLLLSPADIINNTNDDVITGSQSDDANSQCLLSDAHIALILEAKEEITLLLRNYFKVSNDFLYSQFLSLMCVCVCVSE